MISETENAASSWQSVYRANIGELDDDLAAAIKSEIQRLRPEPTRIEVLNAIRSLATPSGEHGFRQKPRAPQIIAQIRRERAVHNTPEPVTVRCRCDGTGWVSVSQMILAEFGVRAYQDVTEKTDRTSGVICPACPQGDAIRAISLEANRNPHDKPWCARVVNADLARGFAFRQKQATNMSPERIQELKDAFDGQDAAQSVLAIAGSMGVA